MKTNNNNAIANKILYGFLFLGILPLGLIFIIYSNNPVSPLLYHFAEMAGSFPAFTSSSIPLMSKVMDLYCKTSPLLAVLLFTTLIKYKRDINVTKRSSTIKSAIGSMLLSVVVLYVILFHNFELTTMGRPIRSMANGDFSLLIIYVCLYFLIFMLTYALLLAPLIIKKAMTK
ncbi:MULTISPECIES: colicin immunity protein Cui [unclassified Cedecea]|uniref:colicin immunity protein Cui n=1 Tax=unclassified Cedecea TaxID=2649846 RepID=UPI003019A209